MIAISKGNNDTKDISLYFPDAVLTANDLDISFMRFTEVCDYNDGKIQSIYSKISPYLFPFSVEFSILIGK